MTQPIDNETAIAELIDAGRAKLQAMRVEQRERKDQQEHERRAGVAARESEAWAAIRDLLPTVLLPHVGLCTELQDPDSFEDLLFRLEVPGCSSITITVQRTQAGIVNGQYTYVYKPSTNYLNGVDRGIYAVAHVDLQTRYDGDDVTGYYVGEWGCSYTSDLELALGGAADQWSRYVTLQAEAERKTRDTQARRAETERLAAQVRTSVAAERERLLGLIGDDPVAIALVELFAAVRRERLGYIEAIDQLTAA